MISLPTECASQAARDMSRARLQCRQLDSTPTALSRALRLMIGDQEAPIAMLDWGYSQATMLSTRDCRPLYVRTLRNGDFASALTSVAQHHRCSLDQAMLILQREGGIRSSTSRNSGGDLPTPISLHIAQLVEELQRTLHFLETHRSNLVPAGLVLTGVGATVKGLPGLLSQELSLPVKVWEPMTDQLHVPSELPCPVVLLAPALAASVLAWENSR